jgi:hypothetical protein
MPQPALSEQTAEALSSIFRDSEERLALALREALAGAQASKAARIRSLQQMVRDEVAFLEESSRSWLTDDLPLVYHAGATAAADKVGSSVADFTLLHREAMQALANTAWSDVLRATRFLSRDTKATIRALAKDQAARVLLGEATASGAGRDLAGAIRERTGMLTVRYANGARHGIADYADTLARTVTANSANEGGFTQMKADRIGFAEAADGPDCGLEQHGVPPFANGMILPLAEARANPLAHPRCARSWSPRPDISNRTEARLATPSDASREAAALEERARADTHLVTGQRVGHFSAGRQPRSSRTPRVARG